MAKRYIITVTEDYIRGIPNTLLFSVHDPDTEEIIAEVQATKEFLAALPQIVFERTKDA